MINAVFVTLKGLNFMRMSARVDGVASRVQSAIQMRQVCNVGLSCVYRSMKTPVRMQ